MDKKVIHSMTRNEQEIVEFVMSHVDSWRNHRIANYDDKWREYERLYRGVFAETDKTRGSERAKIVSPAIQQAVDSRVAEITEATISRNEFFELDDDFQDQNTEDIGFLRRKMKEAFKKDKIRKSLIDVVQLGEIYGTGIGEIILKKVKEQKPEKQQMTDNMAAVGVRVSDRLSVQIHPVHPRNFIIEPTASDLDSCLGYAIEEEVPLHSVVEAMTKEEYKVYLLSDCSEGLDNEPDGISIPYREGKVRIIRWYGKVPKHYIDNMDKEEESEPEDDLAKAIDNLGSDRYDDYSDLVDAIIHIAEGSHLLKAEINPYMMGDRCCVAYRPQTYVGRFWGIGTVEKGYGMQKSLDGQIRAHLDSIAITAAPMVTIDAGRLPRGFKFGVRPGGSLLVNGRGSEIIEPLNLGQANPINVESAQLFERMLQQATGTLDSAGMPGQVNNQTDAGAMAMALSGIIKKHKQALMNFQEEFLIPFITRAAWRYMQFDPDNFPVKDWNFIPSSTMGIMAREYEQQQFLAMMSTLGPESPIIPLLLQGIVSNSSLSNREELIKALAEMSKPDPQAQQQQQQQMMLQMQMLQAQMQEIQAKAASYMSDANLNNAKARVVPMEAQAKLASALSNNLDDDQESKDFQQRAKTMELLLKDRELKIKEKDVDSNERIAALQSEQKRYEVNTKKVIETMKMQRDKDGNLTVTKTKE